MRIHELAKSALMRADTLLFGRSRDRGRTLVVRSTSLGDMVVALPFYVSVQQQRESPVPLLLISRTGNVSKLLLPPSRPGLGSIDPSSFGTMRHTLRHVKLQLTGQSFSEVLYATQDVFECNSASRLALIRMLVGFRPRVKGLCTSWDGVSHAQLSAAAGSTYLAPFLACGITPSSTRSDVHQFLQISDGERAHAASLLARLPVQPARRVAMYVHAKDARKRWPLDRYVSVARQLLSDGATAIVLVGGAEDADASDSVANQLPREMCVQTSGVLTVRETFAVLAECNLYVGNDGAASHLAALAGIRSVVIFCNWDKPGYWEPIASPASISLRPAGHLRGATEFGVDAISVSDVVDAAERVGSFLPSLHEIVTLDGRTSSSRRVTATPFRD